MAQKQALIAVQNVAYHFDVLYSYKIPESLLEECKTGSLVQIPFGRGTAQRQGIVFFVEEINENAKKPISKVLSEAPLLTSSMIELALFLKERTFCTYFDAAKIQLPVGFGYKLTVSYAFAKGDDSLQLSGDDRLIYDYLSNNSAYFTKQEICKALNISEETKAFERLLSKGCITRNYDAAKRLGNISVKRASLAFDAEEVNSFFPRLTAKQKAVVDVLGDVGDCTVKELCYYSGVTSAVVTALEKKGVIELRDEEVYRIPKQYFKAGAKGEQIKLNAEQDDAYNSLLFKYRSGGGVALLYGVTGSGKTSVFLKLIDSVISDGKEVIVMVSEISLTPQMMAIFLGRYGDKVAIFHSALSIGERKDEYRRVRDKRVRIVVGTRSAIFAPFENLGLIVIDEEQEHTYKSESSPRYHARDVAKYRASQCGALVLLSSATPSLESFSLAKAGKYKLCKLNERYGDAVLPSVQVIDMKAEKKRGNYTSFSIRLQDLLRETLSAGNQAVLLINRRGFNTFAACGSCGKVASCPNCSVSLTYHHANGRLMCHYCGYSEPFREKCSSCGDRAVRYAGTGTQKIELEVTEMFPEAKVLRLDTDSVSSRRGFEKALDDFANQKFNVLLGTQMVAKGLDFKNVTLVGVINADTQLNDDDFRSQETTFDLLTQVVGRAGRGESRGTAVIQTLNPENNVIRLAEKQDYEGFFALEDEIRRSMIYPPYCDICVLTAISLNYSDAYNSVRTALMLVREGCAGEYRDVKLIVLPPTVPRIERINNKHRHRIIIKCKNNKRFRALISSVYGKVCSMEVYRKVSFTVDINPANLS